MKNSTKKGIIKKGIIALVLVSIITFITPKYTYSADFSIGGSLLKEVVQLLAAIGDAVMGGLNNLMLGADGMGSSMLAQDDPNLSDSSSWIYSSDSDNVDDDLPEDYMDIKGLFDASEYQIPNMLYCPENIFANNIAALDVNFLRSNTFTPIANSTKADEHSKSAAAELSGTIATWYKSFRNISIVGLLTVLVYLGIRILISSTASDKAKYKETLQDWLVALCLVFVIHFIMSAILMLTDRVIELFDSEVNGGIVVQAYKSDGSGQIKFRTNLIGLIRFKAQAQAWQDATTYTFMYLVLVIFTCMFTFTYFKRFLYTAFFTMIAPLVALTYPIDKAGDGKAQAFNMWFKEYTMNVIIQPVHLILYTALVSSSISLVVKNPLYAIVAIIFIIPAEKFIKKMFRLDRSETTGSLGAIAGGALAFSGLKKLASLGSGKGGAKGGKGSGTAGSEDSDNGRIFMPTNTGGDFDSFGGNDSESNNSDNEQVRTSSNSENNENENENENSSMRTRQELANVPYNQMTEEEQNIMFGNAGEATSRTPEQLENVPKEDMTKEERRIMEQQEKKLGRKQKILGVGKVAGRAFSAAGSTLWRNKAKIARATLGTGGAMIGAGIGLAAGLATADPSKVATFAAGGAAAGGMIGTNSVNLAGKIGGKAIDFGKGAKNQASNAVNAYNEETKGYEEARNIRIAKNNEKARKEFMKDKNEQRKYKEIAGKIGYTGDIKTLMGAAADYKAAGVDDDLIKNSLKAEYKRNKEIGGKDHKKFIDVAKFSADNGYNKDYIEDDKKRKSLEGVVTSKISNKNQQKEIMQTFAEIHGRGAMYKKNSGIK